MANGSDVEDAVLLEGRTRGNAASKPIRRGLARDCPRYSGGRYAAAERAAAVAGATITRMYRLPAYCRPR